MKRLLILLFVILTSPNSLFSSHLYKARELKVTSESTKETIKFAKFLKDSGVIKYSAYWCPNCLNQSELFGKQAYKELNVVECAKDGIKSQTQLCIDKKIRAFPSWEINGKIIVGVKTLEELAELTGYSQ